MALKIGPTSTGPRWIIHRGASFTFGPFVVVDLDGAARSLVGCTVRLLIGRSLYKVPQFEANVGTGIVVTDAPNGELKVDLSAQQTGAFDEGGIAYELLIVDPGGAVILQLKGQGEIARTLTGNLGDEVLEQIPDGFADMVGDRPALVDAISETEDLLISDPERAPARLGRRKLKPLLDAKADTDDMTAALAAKANASDVTTALAGKADATATTTALALKAPLASPALTGTPTAPTPATSDNSARIATTALVKAALAELVASSPAALDTLNEIAAALGNDENFSATMVTSLAAKQRKTLAAGWRPGAIQRDLEDELADVTVPVTRFGAVADSATGCAAAFQEAADYLKTYHGGGIVRVPKTGSPSAYYRLEYPVQVPSNVILEGEGYGSYVRATADDFITGIPFLMGSFHPAEFPSGGGDMVTYNIGDTVAGAAAVTCDTAADAANFAAGDLAYVWSGAGFQRLGVVSAVNAGTGVVNFEWPFDCAFETDAAVSPWISKFAGESVAPTAGPTVVDYMIRNSGVRNMRIHSDNGNHFARAAILDGSFERLWLTGTSSLVGGNAFTRCAFRGLRGTYGSRFIEVADGGWLNTFEDIKAHWVDKGASLTGTNCVKLGDRGHLRNFRLVDGANRSSAGIFDGFFSEIVEDGEVVVSGTYARIFAWEAHGGSLNYNDGSAFRNIRVVPSGAPTVTRMARLASTMTQVTRATMERIDSDITPSNAAGLAIEACDAVLNGNRLPNTTLAVSAGAKVRFGSPNVLKLRTTDLLLVGGLPARPSLERRDALNLAALYTQSIPSSSSATSETTIVSGSAAAANIVYQGDKIRLRMPMTITGTNNTKMLKVTWCGTALATITLLAATAGDMVLEVEATCVAANGQTWRVEYRLIGPELKYDVASVTAINPASAAIEYIIAGWVTNGSDAIAPSFFECRPDLVGR